MNVTCWNMSSNNIAWSRTECTCNSKGIRWTNTIKWQREEIEKKKGDKQSEINDWQYFHETFKLDCI